MTEPFVFISHSNKDNDFVRHLAGDLRARDINAWVDFEAIEEGARWVRRIEQAVRGCEAAVIVMSGGARESEWVEREALLLLDLHKPLFIAMIEDIPLPLHLITRQYTDFMNSYDSGLRSLVAALRDVLDDVPQAIAEATPRAEDLSPDPNEDNFFAYIEQMDAGEEMAFIARDLYRWAKKEADSVTFGGRHTPCFHARVNVDDRDVTVFSLLAYLRNPAVQVPFDYLSKYPPYTAGDVRLKTLRKLDRLLPGEEQFNDTRADRRPTIPLVHLLGDAEHLEHFKSVASEIINRLKA